MCLHFAHSTSQPAHVIPGQLASLSLPAYLSEAAQQQALVVQQAHEVVGGGGQEGAWEQLLRQGMESGTVGAQARQGICQRHCTAVGVQHCGPPHPPHPPPPSRQLPSRKRSRIPPLPACKRAGGCAGRNQSQRRRGGGAAHTPPAGGTGRCRASGSQECLNGGGATGYDALLAAGGLPALAMDSPPAQPPEPACRFSLPSTVSTRSSAPAETEMPAPHMQMMRFAAPALISAAMPARSKLGSSGGLAWGRGGEGGWQRCCMVGQWARQGGGQRQAA